MKSQIKYNRPITFALLQVYLALMEGDSITSDYFTEITSFKDRTYRKIMILVDDMINDLRLKTNLQRLENDESNSKTEYVTYRYELTSTDSYDFEIPDDLSEEKRILYLPVVTYLKLRKRYYVSYEKMTKYLPNLTHRAYMSLMEGFKNVIGEEFYKNDIKSYIIEEID